MAKKLDNQEVIDGFKSLPESVQIETFSEIKTFMEEKEEERAKLSADYKKVNGVNK